MSYKLQCPWFESPFFADELKSVEPYSEQFHQLIAYHINGYVTIDLPGLTDLDISDHEGSQGEEVPGTSWVDRIKKDISEHVGSQEFKAQEDGYHYSDSPRVFEAWRWSQPVLELARHQKVMDTLRFLYQREPLPFQTINFMKGSNQPLHSDTIHFHTYPELWVAGVWVALEDMDLFNGPLAIVPRSHKLPVYNFSSIGLPRAEYGKQFKSYAIYEEFIKDLVVAHGLKVITPCIKKGQAIIWAANEIHGGAKIIDNNRTRWSQATHYYFEGVKPYSPMFSSPHLGIYSEKDMSTKDILSHEIKT